jgi:hypothetical protein
MAVKVQNKTMSVISVMETISGDLTLLDDAIDRTEDLILYTPEDLFYFRGLDRLLECLRSSYRTTRAILEEIEYVVKTYEGERRKEEERR